jgi:HK97 family phage prohead protease
MIRLETKAALTAVGDAGEISGVAWPFNAGPDRLGDVIERGAFKSPAKLPLLVGHNPDDVVGVWDSIEETAAGLLVKGRLLLNDVPRAREIWALVKSGALQGLSIGYTTKAATPRRGGGRTISKLELAEVSLVTVPAHPRAQVTGAKSATAAIAIAEAINRAAVALRKERH